MIHLIVILDKTGICLFDYPFLKQSLDTDLLAGFASAINMFSATLMEKPQHVETIQMTNLQLLCSYFKNFILILLVNEYDDLKTYSSLITELENIFLELFGQVSYNDIHDVRQFQKFSDVIKNLTQMSVNLGFIGKISLAKSEVWKILELKSLQAYNPQQIQSNILELNMELENCKIWAYNGDLEQNFELLVKILENKQILYLIIEPKWETLLTLVPKLNSIRERFPNKAIYGIIWYEKNQILKENCEVLLNCKIFEINPNKKDIEIEFFKWILDTIIGKV